MHDTLRMFDESKGFAIIDKKIIEAEQDLAKISDDLAGELYGEIGWIIKYNKYYL